MNLIIVLALNAVALLATAYIVPGFKVDSFLSAVLAAIVISAANTFLRPALSFLTAPINILTFGLFAFVVNAIILYAASLLVPGFALEGALPAVLGAVVLAIVSTVLSNLVKEVKKIGR